MTTRNARTLGRLGLVAASLLLLATIAAAAGLTQAERDGYLIWLHSLETTIAARDAAAPPSPGPLYPVGWLEDGVQRPDEEGALQEVAQALDEIESRPRLLQEPTARSPLHALSRARNYLQVAQFDSALSWYATAARRDSSGEFAVIVGHEAMVAAVAAGDSVRVLEELLTALGSRALGARRATIQLSYRFFVAHDDSANLELLVDEAAAHPELLEGDLAFWHAFALARLDRWQESLDRLRGLLVLGGHSQGLAERQRAWVLVAVPDLLLLTGHPDEAEPLYRALAASEVTPAATWATCQVAALDFLAGRFLAAGTAFERICEGSGPDTWQSYACRMAELADEMERLRFEGESHGAAAYYQP
jgi:hypothetical protein